MTTKKKKVIPTGYGYGQPYAAAYAKKTKKKARKRKAAKTLRSVSKIAGYGT